MTLALYGKSRRRQALLVLLAIAALAAATFADSVIQRQDARATDLPDLVVTKTNDTANGQVEAGGTFTWTLTITNQGTGPAKFPTDGQSLLIDDMPEGPSYVLPAGANSIPLQNGSSVSCSEGDTSSGPYIHCTSTGTNTTFAAGESIAVQVLVTAPQSPQTLTNPRNRCSLDLRNVIAESDETNNDCNADTVQVVEELDVEQDPLQVSKSGSGTYLESHTWGIEKTVVGDASQSAAAGETVTFDFDIQVTRDTAYENISANGTIDITNPSGNTESGFLDAVTDDAPGTVITGCEDANGAIGSADGDDWALAGYELEPEKSITCSWSYSQSSTQILPSSFENTATAHVISSSPVDGASDTHTVTFKGSTDSSTPGELDLVDSFGTSEGAATRENLGTVSGPTSVAHSAQVTCPPVGDDSFYQESSAGSTVSIDGTNIAALQDLAGTNIVSDSATVTVDCTRSLLTLQKQVQGGGGSFSAPTNWMLEARESTDQSVGPLFPGGWGTASGFVAPGSTISVQESFGPANYDLESVVCEDDSGTIILEEASNPSSWFPMPASDVTCTFTNVYDPPELTLVKQVSAGEDNDPPTPTEWTLKADPALMIGTSGVSGQVPAGTVVTLSEVGGPSDYRLESIVCVTASGNTVFNAPIASVPGAPVPSTFTMPSEDVTCTFTNVYDPNTLTLIKQLGDTSRDPDTPPSVDAWTLTASGNGVTVSGDSGVFGHVPPGTSLSLNESGGPRGYELTSIVCTADLTGAIVIDPAVGQYTMPHGDAVCTFTNDFTAPTLVLEKYVHGAGEFLDDGDFEIWAEQGGSRIFTAVGPDAATAKGVVDFRVGKAVIEAGQLVEFGESEVSGAEPTLADYDADATCYANGTIMSSVHLGNPKFIPQPGDDYVCVFTNTRKTTGVTITKKAVDASGKTISPDVEFPFTSSEGPFSLNSAGQDTQSFTVPAGSSFQFTEDLSGLPEWQLDSVSCSGVDEAVNGAQVSFSVPADTDVICDVTNRQRGATLTVTKVATPSGTGAEFPITVSSPGGYTSGELKLQGGESKTLRNLPPATYTIDEDVISGLPRGWSLDSVECTINGNSVELRQVFAGAYEMQTPLAPGDDAECTFHNQGSLNLTVCKAIWHDGAFVDGANLPGHEGDTIFTLPGEGGFSSESFTVGATGLQTGVVPGFSYQGESVNAECREQTLDLQSAGGDLAYLAESIAPASPAWAEPLYSTSSGEEFCAYGDSANCDGTLAAGVGADLDLVVINRWQPGTLEVTKTVEWGDVTSDDSATFQLCIEGPSYPTGDCKTAGSDGGTYTWPNLIPGEYTVTEPGVDSTLWAVSGAGSKVAVSRGATATHKVRNTRLSGDISITKSVDAAGGDAGDWSFEVCVYEGSGTSNLVGCVDLDEGAPTQPFENLAPGTYTVVETPDDDYATAVRVNGGDPVDAGQVEVTVGSGDPVNIEFTNTLNAGQLVVEKRYGASFDVATCDAPGESDWPAVTLDGDAVSGDAVSGDGSRWGPVDLAANVSHAVSETPADGWAFAGLEVSEECRVGFTGDIALDSALRLVERVPGVDLGQLLGPSLSVNVAPGDTCTVTYLNEPVGNVVLLKVDEVPGGISQDWTFNDGGAPSGNHVLTTPANPGGTAVTESLLLQDVPAAEGLTFSEVEGAGQCDVTSTADDYETHAVVTYGEEPSVSGLAGAPLVADGDVTYDVRKGETTYVAFANRGCGQVLASANLFVQKFASANGGFSGDEPLQAWSITATGTAGLAAGFEDTLQTDASGMAGFPGVPTGVYTICETPQDGYRVIGSTGDDGQGEVPGECRTGVEVSAEGADINTTVQFFNRPIGDIRVEVRTLRDGQPVDERDGWTISVSGCGYAKTAVTGPSGVALFEDVPACGDLVVLQDPDSKPGFAATGGTSRSMSLAAGETADATFTNEAFTNVDVPSDPTETPEPTPTPAEETPTDPGDEGTATPTPAPTEPAGDATPTPTPAGGDESPAPGTPTPTPVDDVAGEQTPGPGAATATPTIVEDVAGEQTPGPTGTATPVAPDSGTGHANSRGAGTLLASLGLLALAAGMTSLALARRRH